MDLVNLIYRFNNVNEIISTKWYAQILLNIQQNQVSRKQLASGRKYERDILDISFLFLFSDGVYYYTSPGLSGHWYFYHVHFKKIQKQR